VLILDNHNQVILSINLYLLVLFIHPRLLSRVTIWDILLVNTIYWLLLILASIITQINF
jgi:hypothetical protein